MLILEILKNKEIRNHPFSNFNLSYFMGYIGYEAIITRESM